MTNGDEPISRMDSFESLFLTTEVLRKGEPSTWPTRAGTGFVLRLSPSALAYCLFLRGPSRASFARAGPYPMEKQHFDFGESWIQ